MAGPFLGHSSGHRRCLALRQDGVGVGGDGVAVVVGSEFNGLGDWCAELDLEGAQVA